MTCRHGVIGILLFVAYQDSFADENIVSDSGNSVVVDQDHSMPDTAASAGHAPPPCHCLQQKWLDYPGPYDLYICRTFTTINDCNAGNGEEELWYGAPTDNHRPQHCPSNQCEPGEEYLINRERKIKTYSKLSGHGMAWDSARAWEFTKSALESAGAQGVTLNWGAPQFHVIERTNESTFQEEQIYIIAIPVSGKYPSNATYFLCVQIDKLDSENDAWTPAVIQSAKPGTGRQLRVKYLVNDETRTGFIWLKN